MPPPVCEVELVEQHSFANCINGRTFACHPNTGSSIWVNNCRGVFKCGNGQPFRCGYPIGQGPTYNCSCSDGEQDPFWSLSGEEMSSLTRASRERHEAPHDPAMPRFALLLHGLIGTEILSSSNTLVPSLSPHRKTRDSGHASREMLLRHCAATHLRHIIHPNEARNVAVDVFAHSWNPEAGPWFRAAYGSVLRDSRNEPPVWTSEIHKARSQALSIGRAAEMMLSWAAANRVRHRLAIALRVDLMISAPVSLEMLPLHGVTMPHWCCKMLINPPSCAASTEPGARSPLARHESVLAQCTVEKYSRYADGKGYRPKAVLDRRTDEVDRNYFVMDWWLAGPPEVVASWGRISREWDHYVSCGARAIGLGRVRVRG